MAKGRIDSPLPAAAAGLLLIAAALLAAPGTAAEIDGFGFTRSVEVTRPGLVKVTLTLDDTRQMLPAAADLHLFSPSGDELPYRHLFESAEERRTPVRLESVEERPGGWRLRLDAGSAAAPHRALVFEMKQTVLAPAVRLEASPDGADWRLLAEGDLFRVGDDSETRGVALGYEPTTDRFLRLDWPAQAGFPEAEKVSLDRHTATPLRQRVSEPDCHATPPATMVCRLSSDAPLAQRLGLEITGEGTVGYRLDLARRGLWQPLSQGLWHLDENTDTLRVPPIPRLEEPAELRLELHGALTPPPRLTSYRFDYLPQTVLFHAATAGRYTLAYGSDRRPSGGLLESTPAEVRLALRVEAGELRRQNVAALPAKTRTAQTPLPDAAFSHRWRVLAPAAVGGSVVRLALPPAVLAVGRRGLADLRLAVEDRQLPFVHRRDALPAKVGAVVDGSPRPGPEAGTSVVEVRLAETDLRLTQIELTTRSGPFRRGVVVRPGPDPRRKLGSPTTASARADWICDSRPPLPCRLRLALGGVPSHGLLQIELDDGDNPPLDALEVAVWRAAHSLVFAWPERGQLLLLAGNPEVGAPAYDLALISDQLLRRSWVEGRLDLESAAESRAATERRGRLLLTAVLAVAALFLLFLLARLLGSRTARRTR